MKFRNVVVLFALVSMIGLLVGGGIYFSIRKKRAKIVEKRNYAINQLDKKEYDSALKALAEIYDGIKGSDIEPEVLFLLADTQTKIQKYDDAKKYAEQIVEKFPESEFAVKAKITLGEIALESGGDIQKAEKYFKELAEKAPDTTEGQKAKYYLAKIAAEGGEVEGVRKDLEQLNQSVTNPELKSLVEELLGKVNISVLYSRGLLEGDVLYELEKGDSVFKIARKFHVPEDLLMRCNEISDPGKLSIGRRIKIPNAEFSLVVNKSDNTMTLLNHGKFFKKYLVRTGMYDHLTPTGPFKILNKKKDPVWSDPNTHKVYKGGDPENELGTRWMSFMGDSLGIHGTIRPETLGKYTSNGCIGMKKEDVEELFDIVTIGTPLEIKGKMVKSAEAGKESGAAKDSAPEKKSSSAKDAAAEKESAAVKEEAPAKAAADTAKEAEAPKDAGAAAKEGEAVKTNP